MARRKHGGADYGGQVISRTVNHWCPMVLQDKKRGIQSEATWG